MSGEKWEELSTDLDSDLRQLDEEIATLIMDSRATREVPVIAPNSKLKVVCKVMPLTPKDLMKIAADEDYKDAIQYSSLAKGTVQSLFELVYAIISINGKELSKHDKIKYFINIPNRVFTAFYQKCVMDVDSFIKQIMLGAGIPRDELKNWFAVRAQEQKSESSSENTGQ